MKLEHDGDAVVLYFLIFKRVYKMPVYKMMQHFGLLCIALTFAGCGSADDTPELGTVSGVVTLDGNPVANAQVTFKPLSGGRISMGISDESGLYTLEYKNNTPGAKVDRHRVSVRTGREAEGLPNLEGYVAPVKETIPEKYFIKSKLEVDVKAGENEIPLDLTS